MVLVVTCCQCHRESTDQLGLLYCLSFLRREQNIAYTSARNILPRNYNRYLFKPHMVTFDLQSHYHAHGTGTIMSPTLLFVVPDGVNKDGPP